MGEFHNIDDSIIIDFEVPDMLARAFREAEESDIKNDGAYFEIADDIDVTCKNMNAAGKLTKDQWSTICKRYKLW